jgi:hypothetical protein
MSFSAALAVTFVAFYLSRRKPCDRSSLRRFAPPVGVPRIQQLLAGAMITLRVTRHDRNEALLAECQSSVIPARGEVLQLDTVEADGSIVRPSTMWRVVAVTVHVPSLQSAAPIGTEPLRVRTVEVSVLPDVSLTFLEEAAEEVLSDSRL